MRFKKVVGRFAAVAVICLAASWAGAQTMALSPTKTGNPTKTGAAVSDPLGRSTPQGTIVGFMMAAQKGDNDDALKYLNTRKSGQSGRRLVDALQAVLGSGHVAVTTSPG